jgi:hypothetical protein
MKRIEMSALHKFKKEAGSILKNIGQGMENIFELYAETFSEIWNPEPLISREAQKILSNPVDKKILMDALYELRDKEDGTEKTITLSSGKTETIFIHRGPTFLN